MRIFALSPAEAAEHWQDFASLFDRFEREVQERTAAQIKAAAEQSLMQIWGIQDADGVSYVAATEVQETAAGNVCVISAACGTARKALQERLLDEIGAWASDIGCVKVRISGRKGWLRFMPRFQQTGIVADWNIGRKH